MVRLVVKRGDQTQFLFETMVEVKTDQVIEDVAAVYNARLKLERICSEIEELAKHGTFLPPDMLGLTDEQIEELKLVDTFGETCIPSGGFTMNPDEMGRRNGKQPSEKMQEVLTRVVTEARATVSKKMADNNISLTLKDVQDQIDILRGGVTIVYPMNLPPHDPIRLEFENKEDLGGTQDSLHVIEPSLAELWFCGKQIHRGKLLKDFLGNNEKTKVIVKIQKKGQGAPAREPAISEEEKRALMLHAYRKQEEEKKLEVDDDDEYLNSAWADSASLKRSFQGLNNISWGPK